MGKYFGTDGIRGVVGDFLTCDMAFRCGNALASSGDRPKILVGGDTRVSRSMLTSSFSAGAMSAGADVVDVGVCTTPGIAFLTENTDVNFGIVVSASHNPVEYNGIKVFDGQGIKLNEDEEDALEEKFGKQKHNKNDGIGQYVQDFSKVKLYKKHLIDCCGCSLENLTIVLDGSNGTACKIAPAVFRALRAKVVAINCKNDGTRINKNCGSTCPEAMMKAVKRYKADVGFAFDGDADRIIACDENGNMIDGDIIIFMLAKYFKSQGKLHQNTVVGTKHTNMGLEKDLQKEGIKLIRTDIGDKYVIAKMEELGLNLGGEKSGHVILRDFASTGDGILTGIKLAEMMIKSGKKMSEMSQATIFPQCNIDCIVSDKAKILASEKLTQEIEKTQTALGSDARIMVRASGTEPKIRIMIECQDNTLATKYATNLKQVVCQLDKA